MLNDDNEIEERITTNASNQFGFGIITGFQYYFNDQISLSTESTLLFSFVEQETRTKLNSLPVNITEKSSMNRDIKFLLPTSIFLVFSF